MAFDPDSAAFLTRLRELNPPRYETLSPEQARAAQVAARKAAAVQPPAIGQIRELELPVDGRLIKARCYRPVDLHGVLPLLVFFHGGGWVLGDLESHDILCRRLSNAGRCAVLAIDYRLAPEHKFPAAIDDAIAATKWAFANASKLDADPLRMAIGGDSSGANLSAVVAHVARDEGAPRIRFQLLIYPAVELSFVHPSHQLSDDILPVLNKTMVWFRDHYLSDPEYRDDWWASPLRAKNFAGLPPAYILTAGYDPLVDEGRAYAEKLSENGVKVEHRHFAGQFHGFLTMGVGFPTTELAIGQIGIALQQALEK